MSERLQKSFVSSNTNKTTPKKVTQTGVVIDIILDDSHPRLKNKLEKQQFYTEKDLFYVGGAVIRPFSDKTTPNERLTIYRPLNQHEIDLPVIGETVELIEVAGVTYYKRLFGNSLNRGKSGEKRAELIYPDKEKTNNVSNYGYVSSTGTPLGNTSSETNDTSKFGKYFTHNPVNRLKLFEGDKIIQSRFGQSIRFSGYNNSNNVFSPTLIIRNKQNPESFSNLKEGDLTEEEVNKDGSIIVFSSGEYQIPFVATTSTSPSKFSSYPNPLKGDDHLLINSGKIIISSKTGEMVFHSKSDYGFISDGKFSIDNGAGAELDFGDDVIITTDRNGANFQVSTGDGKIFLNTNTNGKSPNTDKSSEPLVRGNTLKELLETLIDLIKEQVYKTPSGPTAIGPENKPDFDQLKSRLSEMLSTQNFTE